MVKTFGLKKGQPNPDPAAVDAALDKNTNALMDVVQGLVNGISQTIMANGQNLDGVVKRLTNSVNGHLRKNAGLMKPIGNELVSHVDNYIAQNQALIQTAASNPEIADYVRSVPAAAGYTLSTPVAPSPDPPAATAAPRNAVSPPAAPPAAPPDLSQTWTIFFNCQQGMIAIVPDGSLAGPYAGWRPGPPWAGGDGFSGTRAQLIAYLEQYGQQMYKNACPNSPVQV